MTPTETAETAPRLLTTEQVRERLGGISRDKFFRLRKQLAEEGRPLRPVKLGYRSLRWPEADIDALIEALREPASP